ncbi:MAG: efflux RND transporter permease subunit, partial [Desulfobacterales bacterium]|nr:efflux RND transporter permease subunit [Desulfobacterales bacterium]
MIFIIVAGTLTVIQMRRELNPQFVLDMINISVPYAGAIPEEIEEGICVKIEDKIKSIEGISRTFSTAREGMGSVTVELDSKADVKKVLDDIKMEVDHIATFPIEAEDPIITEIINRTPAISVAVYGDASEKRLREVAERIRDDLIDMGGITLADLLGVRDYEISVEVSEENLRRYGISFEQVAKAIRTGSTDLPGGAIKTSHGEVLVRSKGQLYTGREFEEIPLITLQNGTSVRLKEVTTVNDGFEDVELKTRFNGKPAAVVQVNRTTTEDVIEISRIVRNYVERKKDTIPEGIKIAIWGNIAPMVEGRINLLLRNGVQGMILVFLILALFLNLRLAFWVSAGIPISFMAAFMVLEFAGKSINMISLFAFIMTLGILVDDAIIVGENIYTHFGKGKSPSDAVVCGLKEVGWPVVIAVSTTVVAFAPLLFVTGIIGKFIAVMPQAVIAILVVSLFEALMILPAHLEGALTGSLSKAGKITSWHEDLRNRVEKGLNHVINHYYHSAVTFVVKNRYFSFAIGIGVLIISLGVVIGGYVPFVFFPKAESDWVIAEVSYPLGTPFKLTEETIAYIENKSLELNPSFKKVTDKNDKVVVNIFSLVGVIPRKDWKPGDFGGHCGEIWLELVPAEKRPDLSANIILSKWRTIIGEIPGLDRITFSTLHGGPGGNAIEIQLAGKDFSQLTRAADKLKAEIGTYPGTYGIVDDFRPGKKEMQIRIKEGAKPLGITMAGLARQLRQAFYGEEALRIQRGMDDLKVMVRYAGYDRQRISGVEEMHIRTPEGNEIPIEEVAEITYGQAHSVI